MNNKIKTIGSCTEPITPLPTPEACDVIEVRLDGTHCESDLLQFIKHCPMDVLITARDQSEGGLQSLSAEERMRRATAALPYATYLDVEMRNWNEMEPLITEAKAQDVTTVASYHDFEKTPTEDEINTLIGTYRRCGADILKFAFMTHSIADIATCQSVLFNHPELQLAIMGMGAYAPASRLLLAQSGSVLNYGYLGNTPTAPGQWSAAQLKQAIQNSEPLTQ